MIVYGVPISVHTRKVILAARMKRIDFKIEPVIPFQPPPNWSTLSPTGLIPAMEDGDFALADSTAICLYFEHKQPEPALLPNDAREYGRALFLDAYAGDTLFRHVVQGLFVNKVIKPRILNQPTDQVAVDTILNSVLPGVFGYLDGVADKPSPTMTLADLALMSNLINYSYLGLQIDSARFPRLSASFRRRLESPLLQETLAAEQPFVEQMGLDRSFLS